MRSRRLALLICATSLAVASEASADVRSSSIDDPRDTPVDVNGNYNHQDVQQVRVSYDTAGTLTVTVRFFAPVPPSPSYRSFDLTLGSGLDPCTTYGNGDDASMSFSATRANSSSDSVRIRNLEGSIPVTRTVSDDGHEITATATHPALANRAYKCSANGRLSSASPSPGDSVDDSKLIGPGAYRDQPFPAPACSSDYVQNNRPALQISGLPSEVAFGRRVEFDITAANEDSDEGFPYRTHEPAFLAMVGSKEKKPYLDTDTDIVDETYFLQPEPREGRSHNVALSYVEGPDQTGQLENGNCRRLLERTVRAVRGFPPKVSIDGADGEVEFGFGTRGKTIAPSGRRCSLTAGGSVIVRLRAPDKVKTIKLTDACTGRWSRSVRGLGWRLRGTQNPDEFSDAIVTFEDVFRTPGKRNYSMSAYFQGRRIGFKAFSITTRIR
ncbi:MAG TPA: hypothetical protein VF712_18645 [Thermoleophilaceae bacterium]|jgi:hypothetical protein